MTVQNKCYFALFLRFNSEKEEKGNPPAQKWTGGNPYAEKFNENFE